MQEKQLRKWLDRSISRPYTLIRDHRGISNDSYILEEKSEKYVIRTPKQNHDLLDVHFQQEQEVLKRVKDLDVPLVYFDVAQGIKITKYVPDPKTYKEEKDKTKAVRVGRIVKKLHEKEGVDFVFDPMKKLALYKKHTKAPFVRFENEEQIIEAVKKIYTPDTLCHNDLVDGNLLFSNGRLYLIDYEYASMNDFRFDLASFLSENDIRNEEERELFFHGYGIEDEKIKQEILLFELFEDILWGFWANMLYESTKEEIYQMIAFDKVRHYEQQMNIFKRRDREKAAG